VAAVTSFSLPPPPPVYELPWQMPEVIDLVSDDEK
jgi:hypothetical protein